MSLQVWLPLRGDLTNNGLAGDINIVNNSVTYNEQGKIGSCAYFNGSSFLSITSHKKAVSVCFWLKTTKKMQAIFVEPISKIAFGLNANLNMTVSCVNRNVPIYTNLNAIQDDTWTHITLVDIGTDVLLYINGNLETARGGNNYWIHQNNELLIGKRQASSDSFFTGYLNDFRIYDHVLSQKQIKQIAKGLILHYKLDNNGYGNPNLITKSIFAAQPWISGLTGTQTYKGKDAILVRNNVLYTKTSSGTTSIFPALTFKENTQYTLSLDWCDHKRTDGKSCSLYFCFRYTDGSRSNIISPTSDIDAEWVHVVMTSTAGKTVEKITTTYGNGGYDVSIANFKLEEGNHQTRWSPPIDESDNIVRDCSGYENDGQVIGEVLIDENSPRYGSSVKLKGSASSVIKVTDNKWMVQGADSITINFWAKAVTWPTNGGRCVSCTQSGGFNLQAGNSGYWRFAMDVYTNAAQTSRAYQSDSAAIKIADLIPNAWNMITLTYNKIGSKTYINGLPHHTYTKSNYGIHFNKSARLFLGCEANTANPYTPYFNGWLSDFRIYGTVLSDDDIRQLYQVQSSVDRNNNIYAREIIEE